MGAIEDYRRKFKRWFKLNENQNFEKTSSLISQLIVRQDEISNLLRLTQATHGKNMECLKLHDFMPSHVSPAYIPIVGSVSDLFLCVAVRKLSTEGHYTYYIYGDKRHLDLCLWIIVNIIFSVQQQTVKSRETFKAKKKAWRKRNRRESARRVNFVYSLEDVRTHARQVQEGLILAFLDQLEILQSDVRSKQRPVVVNRHKALVKEFVLENHRPLFTQRKRKTGFESFILSASQSRKVFKANTILNTLNDEADYKDYRKFHGQ